MIASQAAISCVRAVSCRGGVRWQPHLRKRWQSSLAEILRLVEAGKLRSEDASSMITHLQMQSSSSLSSSPEDSTLHSFANLDHGRANRTGFPEAVFAEGKTPFQVAKILDDMALNVNNRLEIIQNPAANYVASTAILATRVTPDQFEAVSNIPLLHGSIEYHEMARIISMTASGLQTLNNPTPGRVTGEQTKVVIACAGTTDLPVAEEAAVTLEAAGCEITRVYDAGVAGLHRIITALPKLRDPQVGCVIVCAGMDGALPSVVGGLVSVPVIAVPTSIGYGASFGGVSAMLTMLNSCAPGVGVVNIDNGFGAAALAYKCIRLK